MIGSRLFLAAAVAFAAPILASAAEAAKFEGTLPAGGRWVAEKPADWNGALLLWSRGYAPETMRQIPIQVAPRGAREWLLDHGYALAGSDYSRPGWALEEAVPDQIATLDAAIGRIGEPKRVIAWGASMGGLITVALAERHPERFAGALPSCGSVGGAIGMMNMAQDGAFAFKTLVAPDSDIRVAGVDDDRTNGERVRRAVEAAQATPEGRARIALAAALAGLPAWSDPRRPEPSPGDHAEQQRQTAAAFPMGVFFPRVDQERRAGGVFSWNEGVDYRGQLRKSGRQSHVAALYREAGIDLKADLKRLNDTPRIKADANAVVYMRANYTPSGALSIPMLSYHEIGDGMTPAILERGYADAVHAAGAEKMLRTAWVRAAGHCGFNVGEQIAALQTLEHRLETGSWDASPAALNARADSVIAGSGRFTGFKSPPFLRPCTSRMRTCR